MTSDSKMNSETLEVRQEHVLPLQATAAESLPLAEGRERNYGIDLLRMVSMILVAVLHVLGQGGVLSAAGRLEDQTNFEVAWFLEIAAYCAVNCYALISGYVGIHAKYKYSNIVMLWLQVFFYTGLITLLFSHFEPDMVGETQIWNAFFPAVKSEYWYFSAYFGMFFFIPLFNSAVHHLSQNQMRAVLIATFLLFSILPSLFRTDLLGTAQSNVFWISNGYNIMWLSSLYLLGAYLSKYKSFSKIPSLVLLLLYLLSVYVTWILKFHTEHGAVAVHYTSPTILLSGMMLVLLFSRLRFRSHSVQTCIRILSPAAFGVYLIHTHPLIWKKYMLRRYVAFSAFEPWRMVFAVFCAACCIYAVCTVIDLVRHYLFKLLHLKQGLEWLEKRICGNLWTER